jgi:hypothetical protein
MFPTSSTLATVVSPPRKRSRTGIKHSITDEERRALRRYWQQKPIDQKLTQEAIQHWFNIKYHPISQSTVSDSLKPTYDYLDKEKKLAHPERSYKTQGNWPDLEAALHQWEVHINRSNNTVSELLLQEIAKRLWQRLPQYQNQSMPKFSIG